MRIPFWKMHGAGNDFILVDDREQKFPCDDPAWLAQISSRRTGVGCEGVILIQPSPEADFRMRFFNPDGGEVEMCGNGARCVARLAHDLGIAPREMTIDTVAGLLHAEADADAVRLQLTPPENWRLGGTLEAERRPLAYDFVNTGVPHAVVRVESADALAETDVQALGRAIRYHSDFAPAGTNANFLAVTGQQSIAVRTYERGVEAETLACGTGIAASALVAARVHGVAAPVTVSAASGDTLSVEFVLDGDETRDVTLVGPAVHVFQGELVYER